MEVWTDGQQVTKMRDRRGKGDWGTKKKKKKDIQHTDTDIHIKYKWRRLGSGTPWWSATGPLQGPSPTQQDLQRAPAQSAMSVSLHPNDDATNMAAAGIHRGQTLVYLQRWSEALTRPGQTQCSVFSSAPY